MSPINQSVSDTQRQASAQGLPGMQPVGCADWITVDAAFSDHLAQKAALIETHRHRVLRCLPEAEAPAKETLDEVLALLHARSDFKVSETHVRRPDDVTVPIIRDAPLLTLSTLIQEDLCILQKDNDVHRLTAALLCFPASWSLEEKIGRDLPAIHGPVEAYDPGVARRVQRLFDGVRVGHPIWRANLLNYADPVLYQPRSEKEPREQAPENAAFERSERQTLWRLPRSNAVVFSIHTTLAML